MMSGYMADWEAFPADQKVQEEQRHIEIDRMIEEFCNSVISACGERWLGLTETGVRGVDIYSDPRKVPVSDQLVHWFSLDQEIYVMRHFRSCCNEDRFEMWKVTADYQIGDWLGLFNLKEWRIVETEEEEYED